MKVIIFGASGFVGMHTIRALRNSGMDLLASDLRKPGEDCEFRQADLLHYDQVADVVRNGDVIIHLAASPLPESLKDPVRNARINIEGSLNILNAAKEYHIRKVIFSSASSLVGEVRYNPVDEIHPCTPKTPYGVAKLAMEHYLRVYHELFGLDSVIFRFFNVYGPGQAPESGALIPMIFQKITRNEPFTIFGSGSQTRDFIFVEDLADFLVRTCTNDVKNEIINMGTGKGYSVSEILALSGKILNRTPNIVSLPPRPGEIDNFVADTKKLSRLYGAVPSTPIGTGLAKTFDWLRDRTAEAPGGRTKG